MLILRKHDNVEVLYLYIYIYIHDCVHFSMLLPNSCFLFYSIDDLDNAHYNYMHDVRHAFRYRFMCMSVEIVTVVVLV